MSSAELANYQRLEKVGEGTYGIVYKAADSQGNFYALKTIRLEAEDEGIPSTAIREISLLKDLKHPNIVYLHEVVHSEKKLTLVFEFVDQDLKKVLDKNVNGLPLNVVKSYLYQLLSAIEYCHSKKVIHRDLKPQNLLISNSGILKLADFGLARACGIPVRSYTHEVVTLWYRSPDILMGNRRYTFSIDVWSIACIFVEMVSGKPLFPGANEQDQLLKIFTLLGTVDEKRWPKVTELPEFRRDFPFFPFNGWGSVCPALAGDASGGISLLSGLLEYDPDQRLTAGQAMHHAFFASVLKSAI
jgi:cyclin-dependent kinase